MRDFQHRSHYGRPFKNDRLPVAIVTYSKGMIVVLRAIIRSKLLYLESVMIHDLDAL